jgi:glycyl-tRNA synthetase beta chain
MKENLVLEIGVEDLPESFCECFDNFLLEFKKILIEERIEFSDLKIFYTPRRIIFFLKEVAPYQKEKITEISGPPLDVCIDKNNKWTIVAQKFAEAHKVKLNQLKIFDKKGKKFVGIVKIEKGRPITKIFNNILNKFLEKIEIPRGMIWDEKKFKFFRPIRYIFAIYGKKLINVEIGDIKSKNFTYGHRTLSDKKIKVKDTKDYFDKILKNFVIFDQGIRKRMIEEEIKKIINEKYDYDSKLIEKIVPLIEYPVCGLCNLTEKYKELPKELIFSIVSNVKGIPLFNKNGEISPLFIVICDGVFNEKIKENYQKVIESKIGDAVFFMNYDLNKKPFIEYLNDLKNIVYHPSFGTIYDRVERIRNICKFLCSKLNLEKEIIDRINTIVSLCKNDIATTLGTEFPSLHGIIGKIYSEKNGYDEIVSKSIEQHYRPRFFGDKKPEFIESSIVSIADRIETICSFISEGIEIKGDQDPLGIKRITTGMIEIIWDKKLEFSISKLIEKTLELLNRKDQKIKDLILDFIFQRAENLLISENISPGLRKSVFSVEKDNLFDIRRKIDAIKSVIIEGKGEEILIPFIRVANMLKEANKKRIEYGEFNEELLKDETEKELYQFLIGNKEKMEKYFNEKKYNEFLEEMRKWKNPIDKFFDDVFVMVEDEKIRNNRLSLLKMINDIFIKFADFSYIPLKEVENVKRI